jgi:elongation factor P
VVDTADPASAGRGASVGKDARLACGLTIKVPMFIKVGELVKVDSRSHEYMGKGKGD